MKGFALLLGLLVAAPALAAEDYRNCGETWHLAKAPERILALNQHAADLLLELGAGARLAGVAYLDDPGPQLQGDRYRGVPVVSARYPSTELLYALRPDLVVGGFATAFDPGRGRAELAAAGIASYLLEAACAQRTGDGFGNVRDDLRTLGRLLGAEPRAQALIDAQQADLRAAAARADGRAPLRVFYLDSSDAGLASQGGRGFVSELLRAAGARNLFEVVALRGYLASPETLLAGDPDVILLADARWSPAAEKVRYLRAHPLLSRLRAVREGRFVTLPFSQLVPGVESGRAARSLAEALYP
ncbi:ABC transporter substrate-binding protein [Pseudomonas citronellolis]|uniref:ABC transporter substrate-binding protein n=1 Tax=Pseudomonas citronellolis TaxID=53408 RepID=UPI00227111BF|nr:ABC transporter substrate-binding protein [Pseudomonas citronellolis]WAB90120.1 ABC transporter substrate-binding protein [Pseudomonas citronellolis]